MQLIASILINALLIVGVLNVPAHWFSVKQWRGANLGTAFTDIAGANNLSDFPTTYNNNLDLTANITTANAFTGSLNTFLNASSTIFSCGVCYFGNTATSSFSSAGALTLITPLAVASGGTASTTISSNRVILGDGASGFKTVNGFGTSAQFLTSNGADTAPTWQTSTVDQAGTYNWTGSHVFNNASSTFVGNLNITGTSTIGAGITVDGRNIGVLVNATSSRFTATGTWTRPPGVTRVRVEVVGGGGGGGGTSTSDADKAAGGGGSGGYAMAVVVVSGNVTVTVGAGGAGDTDGTGTGVTGGNSSFAGDVTVTANGGVGGSSTGGGGGAGGAGGSTTNALLGISNSGGGGLDVGVAEAAISGV